MNTLIVIESLTIVNLLNKVQFPFVKVFPPQMLSSSSEGAIVQAVPIAFAPVDIGQRYETISFSAFIYHKIINKNMHLFENDSLPSIRNLFFVLRSILQYFLVPDGQVPFLVRGAVVPIVPIVGTPMIGTNTFTVSKC